MTGIFSCCEKLESLNVSNFNTSNVIMMSSMFACCRKLTSLDLSNFNTSKVTDMSSMFYGCDNLESIDVSNFNTMNVKSMHRMFMACVNLKSIDTSPFNTSCVTNMEEMFLNCKALESLNVNNFNTSNVTNMASMFYGCSSLTELDVSNFDTSNLTTMSYMFGGCNNLKIIQLGNFFSFKGNNIENTSNQALLPNPSSETPYTGNWIREDRAFGPSSSSWLRDNYDGSTMAGKWVWEEITYSPYLVKHYVEKIDGTYELKETENREGITDSEVTATGKAYTGFTFDDSIAGTVQSGNIAEDGSLVLKLYYKRNSYNVTYSYTGEVPENASELPARETYKYGEEIILPDEAEAEGYTFSGWIKDYLTMPANDIEITGYFIIDYAIDNTENMAEGDGIPDKYQIKINYKVRNGTWNDGTNKAKTEIITLYDKDGNYSESGTGTIKTPEVGNNPSEGYTSGTWNKKLPSKVSIKDNGNEYIYSYEKIETMKTDISDVGGKTSNPKTNDTIQHYLTYGVVSIMVLFIANKIRKKYSKKMRKIQF